MEIETNVVSVHSRIDSLFVIDVSAGLSFLKKKETITIHVIITIDRFIVIVLC